MNSLKGNIMTYIEEVKIRKEFAYDKETREYYE